MVIISHVYGQDYSNIVTLKMSTYINIKVYCGCHSHDKHQHTTEGNILLALNHRLTSRRGVYLFRYFLSLMHTPILFVVTVLVKNLLAFSVTAYEAVLHSWS